MAEYVRITDVSPRDGLQNEAGVISTADKVRLVEMLCEAGVDEVEVTSFVSAKWVPQLGDAAEVLHLLLKPPPGGRGLRVGSDGELHMWRAPARQSLSMDRAKLLRKNTTGPEDALWHYLREREWMGSKFRRQHPFGPYILDFFCQEKLLAIEVDGETHGGAEAKSHDDARDAWVAARGVRTVRFGHDAVVTNAKGVASAIRDLLRASPSLGARRPMKSELMIGGAIKGEPAPNPLPPGGGFRRPPLLSALVPNMLGLQAALDVNKRAERSLIGKVSVFTAASEAFAKKNTNATIAETIERFGPVIAGAHAENVLVRGYVSCVIACPFEGAIAPGKVAEVAGMLRAIGVDELDLGDTIGAGTPETVEAMLRAVDGVWPIRVHLPRPEGENPPPTPSLRAGAFGGEPSPQPPPSGRGLLTLHLHDTFGRAAACVTAGLEMGVRSFDGSVAGLGGCPYASVPGKRAPGNIDTRVLIETIHGAGYFTGVDLDDLDEAAAFAREIVARARGRA